MTLQWSSRLELGIESIDREHQVLVNLIGELDAAIRSGKANQEVGDAIDTLSRYTVMHFGREELLFAQHGYADSADHKQAHKTFVDKIAEFRSGHSRGRIGLSYSIMTYLEEWIEKHILATDKKYVAFLQRHGVR